MKPPNDNPGLQIRIDTHQCSLSDAVRDRMRGDLDALARQVADFPVAEVHILVERNGRSNDYSVKTSLILPGATLVSNDHDPAVHAAFVRCLQSLEENVRGYKDRLGKVPERQKQEKGTHADLMASVGPDPAAVEEAVRTGDYADFRTATFGYEDAVRMRIGRWLERYPEVNAQVGRQFAIEDVVEAVFLDAFEAFDKRPAGVRFGDWLDGLIDPAVRALGSGNGELLENVRLARTAREAEQKGR
jgi:ribosome-associated translation inhibitor RaiA